MTLSVMVVVSCTQECSSMTNGTSEWCVFLQSIWVKEEALAAQKLVLKNHNIKSSAKPLSFGYSFFPKKSDMLSCSFFGDVPLEHWYLWVQWVLLLASKL